MEKRIETQEENVVANIIEFDDYFEVNAFIHIKFNDKQYEFQLNKIINKR